MDHEYGHQNTTPRRSFLRAVGGAVATGTLVSTAGCLDLIFGRGGGPAAGTVPGGGAPTLQDIQPADATHEAASTGELREHASNSDGRIVWLSGDSYDLTGNDLSIEGITLASGRSEGSAGAVITTSDEGFNSNAWSGGSGFGLIQMGDNARITGVEIRGPHTDVTDHNAIPGYFPFAPGGSSARREWRRARFARGITIEGDNCKVDNCEIWGFGVQGIAVGPQGPVENAQVAYCHLHNNMMTSYGYCVDVRHGTCTVYRCYLDAARHAICSSGMGDANYNIIESTFGPWTSSHPIDCHRVGNNVSGSSDPSDTNYRYRAGGTMLVRGCNIMPTRVPDLPFINHNRGEQTPHASIRGVPGDKFVMENCHCGHSSPTEGINQSGVPGRFETDSDGFVNIHYSGNEWGVNFEAMQQVP